MRGAQLEDRIAAKLAWAHYRHWRVKVGSGDNWRWVDAVNINGELHPSIIARLQAASRENGE